MQLPEPVQTAARILRGGGYEAYAVGGCVRDVLLGRTPHDWDMTTNALPAETERLFAAYPVIETGIAHGTVMVVIDAMPIEITTYRVDGAYSDHRHPDGVQFTANLKADLARRDFTINAMAYAPETGVVDPFGGQADLARQTVRCVGDPARRFDEDALRILRALRFASVLGFAIDPDTAAQVHAQAAALRAVAVERRYAEWQKLICGRGAAQVLREYPDVAAQVLPAGQTAAGWAARVDRMAQASPDFAGRMAILLRGSDAAQAMRDLRASRADQLRVSMLAGAPETLPPATDADVRRGLAAYGADGWRDSLRMFPPSARAALEQTTQIVLNRGDCWRLDQLAIDGRSLAALGLRGAALGETLRALCRSVIDGTLPNTPDALRQAAKKRAESQHLAP